MKLFYAAPLPIAFVIVSFLAPTELSLYLAGLRLPLHRLAILIALPFALARIASGASRITLYDILFACFAAWTVFVFWLHLDTQGFTYGGSLALESFGTYIVARAFIRSQAQFLASFRLLMTVVAIAGLIALPEMLLGRHFTHDTLQQLTGHVVKRGISIRHRLTRAYGTFDHPIHLGVFNASVLALAWYTAIDARQRIQRVGIVLLATLTAVSSAPFLCIGLQIAMMIWEKTTRRIPGRFHLTVAALVGLYIGASLVMKRTPIEFIATGMTLDPWTGFYRLQIWEYGLQNVWANPWIGIGLNDWVRADWMASGTADALWLVIMMQQGVPAMILLGLAICLLCRAVARRIKRTGNEMERFIARGWIMSLIALSLLACTVHLWNSVYAYLFFFLGAAGWMADPARSAARTRASPAAARSDPILPGSRPVPAYVPDQRELWSTWGPPLAARSPHIR